MILAISTILAFLLLQPSICQADAISPLINVFTPGRAIPSAILTIFIILVEAFLLRKWIRTVPFKLNLWRSTIINIASSAAGSVAVLTFAKDRMFWDLSGFFLPMFFLTLATETPLLGYLYRRDNVDWIRAAKLSFGINVVSYSLVFVSQIGLVFAFAAYGDFIDKREIKTWTENSLLDGESGFIYAVSNIRTDKINKSILKRYDVSKKAWENIDTAGERGIEQIVWDVRGNILVCIKQNEDWNNRSLSIIQLPNNTEITSLKGNFRAVRLSPDLSKIAALEYVRDAGVPKDAEGYFMLGDSCHLKIFDRSTGKLLTEAPRMSLNQGLAWIDSQQVVFASLKDESLFRNENFPSHSYGRGYAKEGQFPIYLFAFDITKKTVTALVEGQDPVYIPSRNVISFIRERGMYNYEVWQLDRATGQSTLIVKETKSNQHSVSPSGSKLLLQIPRNQLFGYSHFLTVVDSKNQERKLIIEPASAYPFRWVDK